MQLHGKVVSPNRLNLNGNPEILVNSKSGRITLSSAVTSKLGEEVAIGFGYDPAKEQGHPVFLYVTQDGCKVGKSGAVSNKFHATELRSAFAGEEGMTPEITRLKLSVDMENTVEYEGITLYPVSFSEALANLTRTKKVKEEVKPEAVAPCAAHEIANQDLEERAELDTREEDETTPSTGNMTRNQTLLESETEFNPYM